MAPTNLVPENESCAAHCDENDAYGKGGEDAAPRGAGMSHVGTRLRKTRSQWGPREGRHRRVLRSSRRIGSGPTGSQVCSWCVQDDPNPPWGHQPVECSSDEDVPIAERLTRHHNRPQHRNQSSIQDLMVVP